MCSLDPDQDRQNVGPVRSGLKIFYTLMIFLKQFLERLAMKKKSADGKSKHKNTQPLLYYSPLPQIKNIVKTDYLSKLILCQKFIVAAPLCFCFTYL